jgi:hypothetical protein
MATPPTPVRFPSRPQLRPRLQPTMAAKNIPPFLFCASDVGNDPGSGREGRANGCCRPMAWSQPLSNATAAAPSPQTVPIQGDYVP